MCIRDRNTPPNPLPEPPVSLMETCSPGFLSAPLPHDNEISDCDSDNSAVEMCSVGSGDGQFSLVQGKSAKYKSVTDIQTEFKRLSLNRLQTITSVLTRASTDPEAAMGRQCRKNG